MLVVSVILSPCSPNSTVQSPVQPPRQVQESDPVLDEIVRLGPGPVGRWELIEALEPDLGGDRRDLRRRRAALLNQIEGLVRQGRLVKLGRYRLVRPNFRAASMLGAADARYQRQRNEAPRANRITRPGKRTARDGNTNSDGRALKQPNPVPKANPGNKLIVNCLPAQTPLLKPPKPSPTSAEISEAARALGKRRGLKKRWSGYVKGERVWRGREIELPDGTRAYAYGALRGMVVWSFDPMRLPGGDGEPLGWGALPQERVRLVKCAAAHSNVLSS